MKTTNNKETGISEDIILRAEEFARNLKDKDDKEILGLILTDYMHNNQVDGDKIPEAVRQKILDVIAKQKARLKPLTAGEINKAYFHEWTGTSKDPKPKKPFDSRIRDALIDEDFCKLSNLSPHIIVFSGIPWIYEHGAWNPDETGAKLRGLIEQFLYPQFIDDNNLSRIFKLIIKSAKIQKSWDEVNLHPKSWAIFKDCYVDLKDLSVHDHAPEYYTLNQTAMAWNDCKDATVGIETEKYLNFAVPDKDDREMLLQYYGYMLTSDISMQKSLYLYGDGGTGKSTMLFFAREMLGKPNFSSVRLQDLSERFKPARLVGMLANIEADLPPEPVKDSSMFKSLTGGDAVDTERKGKDGFKFVSYARMLFSANQTPIFRNERSSGVYRRLMYIHFDKKLDEPAQDKTLQDKLRKELPYFCKLAVAAAHRAYIQGHISVSPNSLEISKGIRHDSDVIEAWIDDCTIKDTGAKADKRDILESFQLYCKNEGRAEIGRRQLYSALRIKGYTDYRGNAGDMFRGFKLKPWSKQ